MVSVPAEIVGQQLRLRIADPKLFHRNTYGTQNVGERGRLQRVAAIRKSNGQYATQSWRLNLGTYGSLGEVFSDLSQLHNKDLISEKQYDEGRQLAIEWWRGHKR